MDKGYKRRIEPAPSPTLAALLTSYYEGRNAGAWSRNAKIGNLKNFAEAVNYLTERGIVTLEDLEAHIAAQGERAEAVNTSMKAKREQFEREHEGELRTFHMTRRKLDKHRSSAGKIPVQVWEREQTSPILFTCLINELM